jgi:hypothetical protein
LSAARPGYIGRKYQPSAVSVVAGISGDIAWTRQRTMTYNL